jgi:hypothetical protein
MSEGSSDNKSLFRVDLERALEALALNLQKKSNAVKNIVPYCHDMGNALDGLALYDVSQAAIELAQLFKDAKTVQAHRHILEDFQELIRYQLELTEEQFAQQTLQEYKLKKQAFFSKLHIVQPSRLTLEFVKHDIEESLINNGQLDSELTEQAAELLADLETQFNSEISDQEPLQSVKKFYSVQDLLDQEHQESPNSSALPNSQELPEVDISSLPTDSSKDEYKISSSAISHNVFDDLEQSINELDARLKSSDTPVTISSDKHHQQEAIIHQEGVDEPFYIDFPYSREAKETHKENDDVKKNFSKESKTIEAVAMNDALQEELPSQIENSDFSNVSSIHVPPQSQEVSNPLQEPLQKNSNLASSGQTNETREKPIVDSDNMLSDVGNFAINSSNDQTSVSGDKTILDPIEDPFAELDKLSEQFSIAAHQEQLNSSESIPPVSLPVDFKEIPSKDDVPSLKNIFTPEEKILQHAVHVEETQSESLDLSAQQVAKISEVEDPNEIELRENIIESKTNSNLEEWIDHSISSTLSVKPVEQHVLPQKRTTIEFDVQRALNKLQQARGLLPKDPSFQTQLVDGLIEDQQNTVVQSVQVDVGEAFNGLAEFVDSDHVYADQNIIERLLSILSIFPPQKTISMVQQRLLVFIDLQGPLPSEEQLHTANNYLAQICGSLEIKTDLIRITVPSSLLRMEMFCYKRNEDIFAVPSSQLVQAHQYTHDDILPESSLWDVHGVIEGPHHRISVRSGITEHQIYSFETIGSKILNIFEEFPKEIAKPMWLGALGIDGQNRFYHCVFLERFAA